MLKNYRHNVYKFMRLVVVHVSNHPIDCLSQIILPTIKFKPWTLNYSNPISNSYMNTILFSFVWFLHLLFWIYYTVDYCVDIVLPFFVWSSFPQWSQIRIYVSMVKMLLHLCMIWYDMILYGMMWYDMVWYIICSYIYIYIYTCIYIYVCIYPYST